MDVIKIARESGFVVLIEGRIGLDQCTSVCGTEEALKASQTPCDGRHRLSHKPDHLSDEEWNIARRAFLEDVVLTAMRDFEGLHSVLRYFYGMFPSSPEAVGKPLTMEEWAAIQDTMNDLRSDLWFNREIIRPTVYTSATSVTEQGNEDVEADAKPSESRVDTYAKEMLNLRIAQDALHTGYSRLSFRETLAARGLKSFSIAVAAWLGLAIMLLSDVSGSKLSLISLAYGQNTGSPVKPQFVPPLGLPLSTWIPMVIGFYVLLLLIIGILIWQGYITKNKNEKAAAFVDGFGKLALGVFLGKLSGV